VNRTEKLEGVDAGQDRRRREVHEGRYLGPCATYTNEAQADPQRQSRREQAPTELKAARPALGETGEHAEVSRWRRSCSTKGHPRAGRSGAVEIGAEILLRIRIRKGVKWHPEMLPLC
jgi:hypothetical protein